MPVGAQVPAQQLPRDREPPHEHGLSASRRAAMPTLAASMISFGVNRGRAPAVPRPSAFAAARQTTARSSPPGPCGAVRPRRHARERREASELNARLLALQRRCPAVRRCGGCRTPACTSALLVEAAAFPRSSEVDLAPHLAVRADHVGFPRACPLSRASDAHVVVSAFEGER